MTDSEPAAAPDTHRRALKPGTDWRDVPIHVIDLEGHHSYGVVEFGVVVVRHGQPQSTVTRLCQPLGEIPRKDTRVHGITGEEASSFPPFTEEWERFREMRASGPLCAHHAVFEHALLKRQWAFPPFSPDFSREGVEIADWGPWLDTRQLAEVWIPGQDNYRLSEVVAFLGLEESLRSLAREHCPPRRDRYHCALYDALASALILCNLLQNECYAGATFPWLFNAMSGRHGRQEELSF